MDIFPGQYSYFPPTSLDKVYDDFVSEYSDSNVLKDCSLFEGFGTIYQEHDNNKSKFVILVPGLGKEDIVVEADGHTLRAFRTDQEILSPLGRLDKVFDLAPNADISKITAVCKNGLLTITVPAKKDVQAANVVVEGE